MSYVYFIQADNKIKIGYTRNLKQSYRFIPQYSIEI